MSGQGTIGLEIVEQCEDADVIVVPVGGGGLIAGIATAVKTLSPRTKIIVSENFMTKESTFSVKEFSRALNLTNVRAFLKLWKTVDQFIVLTKLRWLMVLPSLKLDATPMQQ